MASDEPTSRAAPSTASDTGAGGSATSSGVDFQQRVAAWFASAMLCDLDVSPALGISDAIYIERISMETSDSVDDFVLTSRDSRKVFVQAKTSPSLSSTATTDFGKAIKQFVQQHQKDIHPDSLYVLAVAPTASGKIKQQLRKLLLAARYDASAWENAPLSEVEKDTLTTFRALATACSDRGDGQLWTADELVEFAQRVHVATFDMDDSGSDCRSAHILLHSTGQLKSPPDLVWSRLVQICLDASRKRLQISKEGLHKALARYFESTTIEAGRAFFENLPLNLEPVRFAAEERIGDYYDGKHARPGHILEGLDVKRPRWLKAIADVFQRKACCVIRASSGQGKSSLLYRYAYEQRATSTILRLHRCSTDAEVDATVSYLREFDGPALVVVDNLGYGTRLWGHAAARLAGTRARFLVSSREEDWHRYAPPLASISCGTVEPSLDMQEAQQIYDELERRGRRRAGVPSAKWAYEKVAARRLLIEFIYLVTHGQMLRERIEDQIRQMHERGEERAKLDVLRLVAMAQVYGSAIPLDALEKEVKFDGDPGLALRSLEGEYLVIERGFAEGLHLVRSEHLVPLLHDPIPTRTATIARLVRILDQYNLASFVAGLVADASISPDAYMDALAARCRQAPPAFVVRLAEVVFAACEQRYIELHRPVYEAAINIDGRSGTFFVGMATMPRGRRDWLKDMPWMSPERKGFFEAVLAEFKQREACGSHEALRLYGEQVIGGLNPGFYTLSEIARLSYWGRYARVEVPWITELMSGPDWEEPLLSADRETVGAFLWEVSRQSTARFDEFLGRHRKRLLARYQVEYEVAAITEDGDAIEIRFVPDPLEGHGTWNKQAVTRLEVLRRWLPRYEKYRSQGIFTEAEKAALNWRDTDKNISPEHFDTPYDDAPQNRIYLDLVNATFAVESIDEWRRHWLAFRRAVLSAIEQLRNAYMTHYRERPVRPADLTLVAKVLEEIRHLPELPPSWQKRFHECYKAMGDFWGSVHGLCNNAVMLLLPSEENGPGDRRALVRTNAFNLISQVPVMQREFAAVAKVAVGDRELAELERKEIQIYQDLMDLAEFDCDQKGSPVRNLRAAITRWRTESRAAFQARITDIFGPLVEAGLTMYFPDKPIQEAYGTSVVIAFEVVGFAPVALMTLLGEIVTLCARAGLELDYLYVVPCVQRQRAVSRALRISRMGLDDVAQGKTPEYGLLPTDDPTGMDDVLPNISRTGPADLKWFWKVLPLIGQLAELRKSFRLLRENLRDEGSASQLLDRRRRVTDDAIAGVYEQYGELRKEADVIGPSLRDPELWRKFVVSIDELVALLQSTPLVDVDNDDFMGTLQVFNETYWGYAAAQYERWEGTS